MLPSALKKLVRGIRVVIRAKKATPKGFLRPDSVERTNRQRSWVDVDAPDAVSDEEAPDTSSPVDSPPRTKHGTSPAVDKPLPPIPVGPDKGIQTSAILPKLVAAAPLTPDCTPTKVSPPTLRRTFARLSMTSSAKSTTGSQYSGSPGALQQVPSVTEERRAGLQKRFGVILFPGLVANEFSGFVAANGSMASPDSGLSLTPKTPPGLPAPHDINLPSAPQCAPADKVRSPVQNNPPAEPAARNPTIISNPSTSNQSRIFSADLKVEEIGSGASGRVYKVTRKTGRGQIVRAVKLVDLTHENAPFDACAQEIEIFEALREYQMLYARDLEDEEANRAYRGLKHVVKLSPHEKFIGMCGNGYLYIIMQHYPMSLAGFQGYVTENENALRFIISQVTHGLNFLHSIGIIHMDLKPGNIFVSEKGNCVIGDFNSSSYDPEYKCPTWLGGCTPGYVAPEAVDKYRPTISPRSDFWSLGVTVYDLVVDHKPFELGLTYAQMGLEAMKMAEAMEVYGCPSKIWYMVNQMCQSDPNKRWDGHKILDHLRRNFDPLPSISPLLEHYLDGGHEHAPSTTTEGATRKRLLYRLAIMHKLGCDLHWSDQINVSRIR